MDRVQGSSDRPCPLWGIGPRPVPLMVAHKEYGNNDTWKIIDLFRLGNHPIINNPSSNDLVTMYNFMSPPS